MSQSRHAQPSRSKAIRRWPQVGKYRRLVGWLCAATFVIAAVFLWWEFGMRRPLTIGMEGQRLVTLSRDDYQAVAYTHGDAVAVRIAGQTTTREGTQYDLRYMLYGPGPYSLTEYLIDPTGSHPRTGQLVVAAKPLLAADESGELHSAPPAEINMRSHYSKIMAALWCGWVLALIPLLAWGRAPRSAAPPAAETPSTAARLAALLQAASAAPLSAHQQADLELLLLNYWEERLQLPSERLLETMAQLRRHPLAGEQLQLLERWLHAPADTDAALLDSPNRDNPLSPADLLLAQIEGEEAKRQP